MKTIKERAFELVQISTDIEFVAEALVLLQEIANAPETEPVAHVTGYYGGYLSIVTVDGQVLSTGTALYAAPPHQSEHHLEMVNTPAPSVPDGWRPVPLSATVEMREAGRAHLTGLTSYADSMALRVYGAMIAAAPTLPKTPADVARDAERYRWLRTYNTAKHPAVTEAFFLGDENLDAEIDAAIAVKKGGAA